MSNGDGDGDGESQRGRRESGTSGGGGVRDSIETDGESELEPPGMVFDLTPGREPSPARYRHGEPLQFGEYGDIAGWMNLDGEVGRFVADKNVVGEEPEDEEY
jgi:hypothetical protein